MKIVIYILIIVGIGFFFVRQRQHQAEERAAEVKYREEKAAAEQAQRDDFKHYAEGLRKLCEEKAKNADSELTAVRDDSVRLAKAIATHTSGTGDDGNGLKYAEKIAAILKDAEINALAHKHLGAGFEEVASEFVARVHEVAAAESKYAAEVRKIDAVHAASSGKAVNWSEDTKKQREAEISRLKKEISGLEKERAQLHKEHQNVTKAHLKGSAHSERVRRDRVDVLSSKMREIDDELFRKRHQIDLLRAPVNSSRSESEVLSNTQTAQREADRIRENAMYDIDRRLKPKESLVTVVSEYDKKTIGRLSGVIADKISAVENESKMLKEKLAAIESFIIEIPVSSISSLMAKKDKLSL